MGVTFARVDTDSPLPVFNTIEGWEQQLGTKISVTVKISKYVLTRDDMPPVRFENGVPVLSPLPSTLRFTLEIKIVSNVWLMDLSRSLHCMASKSFPSRGVIHSNNTQRPSRSSTMTRCIAFSSFQRWNPRASISREQASSFNWYDLLLSSRQCSGATYFSRRSLLHPAARTLCVTINTWVHLEAAVKRSLKRFSMDLLCHRIKEERVRVWRHCGTTLSTPALSGAAVEKFLRRFTVDLYCHRAKEERVLARPHHRTKVEKVSVQRHHETSGAG